MTDNKISPKLNNVSSIGERRASVNEFTREQLSDLLLDSLVSELYYLRISIDLSKGNKDYTLSKSYNPSIADLNHDDDGKISPNSDADFYAIITSYNKKKLSEAAMDIMRSPSHIFAEIAVSDARRPEGEQLFKKRGQYSEDVNEYRGYMTAEIYRLHRATASEAGMNSFLKGTDISIARSRDSTVRKLDL